MGNCGGGAAGAKRGADDGVGPRVRGFNDDEEENTACKLVVMGNKAVGKSSIVLRYTKNQFSDTHELTIGAAFSSRDVPLKDGKVVKLHLWDTAGEELYRAMTRSFYRDAHAGMVVYDITERQTFLDTRSWLRDFREHCPTAVVALVGNKCDMEAERQVSTDEGAEAAEELGLEFFECSAKNNTNVAEMFMDVATALEARRASPR